MGTNATVKDLTRGYPIKRQQALKGIENCALTWVEPDVSVRRLTLAESIAARNEQAKKQEPLAYYEIPGIRYQPTKANERQHFAGMEQVWEAHKFAREATV